MYKLCSCSNKFVFLSLKLLRPEVRAWLFNEFLPLPVHATDLRAIPCQRSEKKGQRRKVDFQRIGPWPILSYSRDVRVSVCLFVLFHVLDFEAYFAPTSQVKCPKFLEIRNPWGKVLERSGLRIEHFCWEVV